MPIMVQVSELDLYDPDGRTIFKGLRFRLSRGEWACVVGPPGSGKTVLLKLICGELRPRRGQILVDDRNISRLHPDRLRQLRRRMGIVLEGMPPLRRRTLEGSLVFKLQALGFSKAEAREKARKTLKLVDLEEEASQAPEALAGERLGRFRLALALCHDPVLLLLDEPLRELEPAGAERLLEILERVHLRKRLSILMTAADALRDERSPHTYHLEEGGIRVPSAAPAAEPGWEVRSP